MGSGVSGAWGPSWGLSWLRSWDATPAPIVIRGDGYPRKKRKREDTEYVPPEFNLDEAVEALFSEKPAVEVIEAAQVEKPLAAMPETMVAPVLISALTKPMVFTLPDFSDYLQERDDEEAILLLMQ